MSEIVIRTVSCREWRDRAQHAETEVERLKGELERLEDILSPEAMRGDQTIDDAYDVVFRALASLEESQPYDPRGDSP